MLGMPLIPLTSVGCRCRLDEGTVVGQAVARLGNVINTKTGARCRYLNKTSFLPGGRHDAPLHDRMGDTYDVSEPFPKIRGGDYVLISGRRNSV